MVKTSWTYSSRIYNYRYIHLRAVWRTERMKDGYRILLALLTKCPENPEVTENLYCICLSLLQIYIQADGKIFGKFWDTQ